jgi:hypothetical protein
MQKAIIAVVLVLSTASALASRWCVIGTAMVMCPKPPVTHAHELVSNLHIAARVR